MKRSIIVVVFALLAGSGLSQIKTTGLPFIKGYNKTNYAAGTQNWDICQDSSGIMYFANNDGVLQFDGERWRTYPLFNNSIVRSLLFDASGKLYASGFNEFGYFDTDTLGDLEYHSLRDKLPEGHKNIGEVWRIHEVSEGIIFQSFSHILLLADNEIKVIATAEDFGFSFLVEGRFFIHDKEEGLKELRGKRLFLLPGGAQFTGEKEVWSMHAYGNGEIIIGTQQHGLFLFDGYAIERFDSPASDILKEKQIFSSERIDNDYFIYGTIQDGIVVMNREGVVIQHLNKDKGLINNTVLSIFQDQNRQIWLALDNGINYVEFFSPFTFIQSGMEIEGAGYDAALFEGKMYLATNQGLFVKQWDHNSRNTFRMIPEIKGQVWSLHVENDVLLIGHNRGVFRIKNGEVKQLSGNEGVWRFISLKDHPDKLLAGTYSSLVVYEFTGGQWQKRNQIEGFRESCRVLEEDENGDIWVSHGYKGVYHLEITDDYSKAGRVSFYDDADGLPSRFDNYVYKLDGEVVFGTTQGLYRFQEEEEQFVPSLKWAEHFGAGNNIRFPDEDDEGNIWYGQQEHTLLLKNTAKGYQKVDTLFNRLGDALVGGFENIVVLPDNQLILCSENGFIHYDAYVDFPEYQPYRTLIRKLVSTSNSDTTIYKGHRSEAMKTKELSFRMNDLMFTISATIYGQNSPVKYSTYLEGYDKGWSAFQNNNVKEYTNLPPGDYVFKVKARDEENHEVITDSFHFVILPPWYRTTIAYVFYAIAFLLLVVLFIRYLSARIKKEKQKLKEKQHEELRRKEEKYRQENLIAEQKIIRLRNEKLQAEIEKKRADMELKSKEAVSVAMQMTHKNEVLNEIKLKLMTVSQKVNEHAQGEIKNLIRTIESDVRMDKDWERFHKHFEDVHSGFFRSLREKYPELTPKDLRMCAYLRMNLSTKEIALISNISVRGAEISRYRLRKKLGLDQDENLVDFMMNI